MDGCMYGWERGHLAKRLVTRKSLVALGELVPTQPPPLSQGGGGEKVKRGY